MFGRGHKGIKLKTKMTEEDVSQIERLTNSETYQIWKFQVTILFKAHGLWEIVSGIKKMEDLADDKEKADFERKDARAQKIIITTIDKKQLMHIFNCKSSKEMYDKLKNIYEKQTEDEKCYLMQQFFNFSYSKGTDILMHISKIENLACRLRVLGQDIPDSMLASKILATLPDQFRNFATSWESTSQGDKTLENLSNRLIGEEERQKKQCEPEGMVFKAQLQQQVNKNKTRFGGKCFKCGKEGHIARYCDKRSCRICKKTNHVESNLPKQTEPRSRSTGNS